jgi:hypothetical protein
MGFTIKRLTTPVSGDFNTEDLTSSLKQNGYSPMISEAKRRFSKVFSDSGMIDSEESNLAEFNARSLGPLIERRMVYGEMDSLPVYGDLVHKQDSEGLLYFLLALSEEEVMQRGPQLNLNDSDLTLEVGYIGDSDGAGLLEGFKEVVGEFAFSDYQADSWKRVTYGSDEFSNLEGSDETSFMRASEVTDEEVELSKILEDHQARSLSIKIRRGGGLLASDIGKRSDESSDEGQIVDNLVDANLLSTEHVIICKQTSSQVNRVPNKEALEKLANLGVQCSCGRSISDERNEELYVPTEELNKLLNQSYWMTAGLVRLLRKVGIPNDSILLNLIEGSDEIDAFVDFDGALLMIELKDSEFSMGHAYAFGGRIAQYKPSYAMIVSTRGVDQEVKDYFDRVEPEADLIYVNSLDGLRPAIGKVGSEIRAERASSVLDSLEATSQISVPVRKFVGRNLEIQFPDRRSRRRRYFARR